MKKRFRKVVKEGWQVVQMDRANLWRWTKQNDKTQDSDWGDAAHYRHIRDWCARTYAKDTWEGRMINNNWWKDTSSGVVTKEFAFKNEQDATMFILTWK